MATPDLLSPKQLRSTLMRGGVGVLLLRVAAVALGFGVDLALTHSLGMVEYGHFVAGVSCITLLMTLSTLGLHSALIKVIPEQSSRGQHQVARGLIPWSARRMVACALVISLALAAVLWGLGERVHPTLRGVLLILALFLPLQVLAVHRQSVLVGLKHPILAQLPEQVLRWVVFLVLLCAAAWSGAQLNATTAAWMYGLGMLAGLGFSQVWQTKSLPAELSQGARELQPKLWWFLALPLCWNTVMRMLNTRADPFLLAWLCDEEAAALFAVANRLASLLLFGLMAAGTVVAPMIAERHAAGRTRELQALATMAVKGLALYALPLAAVLVFAGPWILGLFGEGFERAYPVLCLLVAGRTMTCLVGCVGFLLTMTGHERQVAVAMTGGAAIKIGLNLALIPGLGEVGAAYATLCSLALVSLWLVTLVRREIGVDPTLLSAFRSRTA